MKNQISTVSRLSFRTFVSFKNKFFYFPWIFSIPSLNLQFGEWDPCNYDHTSWWAHSSNSASDHRFADKPGAKLALARQSAEQSKFGEGELSSDRRVVEINAGQFVRSVSNAMERRLLPERDVRSWETWAFLSLRNGHLNQTFTMEKKRSIDCVVDSESTTMLRCEVWESSLTTRTATQTLFLIN